MQLINQQAQLRTVIGGLKKEGKSVALVPTMGALHQGHLALVERARSLADVVVASVFVNPTQFGPDEDFDAYPRTLDDDRRLLDECGADILWAPATTEVYAPNHSTTVTVSGTTDGLCGAARPGHFDGVTTIVAKLCNQTQPDYAVFGEKDYQQLATIRRMVRDLDMPVQIVGVTTIREADGLALSSRNRYLSETERAAAVALPVAMRQAIQSIRAGEPVDRSLVTLEGTLLAGGFSSVDYAQLRDADTLEPLTSADAPARLLVAAHIGKTRLIDNMAVEPIGSG